MSFEIRTIGTNTSSFTLHYITFIPRDQGGTPAGHGEDEAWSRGWRYCPGFSSAISGRGFVVSAAVLPARRSLSSGVEGDGVGFPSACGEGDDRRRPLSGG